MRKSKMSEIAAESHPQTQSDAQSKRTKRFRAAKACRRCNEKRVKCDATELGLPCTRCKQGNRNDCALIQSRRGIYQRKKSGNDCKAKTTDSEREREKETTAARTSAPPLRGAPSFNESTTIHVQPPDQQETSNSSQIPPSHLYEDEVQSSDGQEAAPTSTALTTPTSHGDLASPDSGDTEMSNSSYREISWTTMFDHFLEGRKHGEAVIDKCVSSSETFKNPA